MKIVLSLPYALTSLFVVVAERIPFDVTAVPWRVGARHRRAAIRAIGSPALLVTHHPTPWRPGRTSLTPDERRLPRRSGQHLVISTTAAPHELPGSLQLARATARALAREYDGLLIDPLSGTAVPACERAEGEPVDFDLSDNGELGSPLSPRAAEPDACDGLSVTSRGLRRFALPEITLDGAACTHRECATGLLRLVAHRLVADQLAFVTAHPDARQRTIDDHLRIEPSPPGDHDPTPFTVRLTPCEPAPPSQDAPAPPPASRSPPQTAPTRPPASEPAHPRASPTAAPTGSRKRVKRPWPPSTATHHRPSPHRPAR